MTESPNLTKNAADMTKQALCDNEVIPQTMHASGDSVMLATVIVLVNDIAGVPKRWRALLDLRDHGSTSLQTLVLNLLNYPKQYVIYQLLELILCAKCLKN